MYVYIYIYIYVFIYIEREDFYTCQGKAAVKEEVKRRERKEQKKGESDHYSQNSSETPS